MVSKTYSWIFVCLIFISGASSAALPIQSSAINSAIETGWLRNFNHLPVQVNLQLTGQVNSEQKQVNGLLNINLDKDWKTYWRSPGEGGVAPTFNWQDSSNNIADIKWLWPAPQRYPVLGVETLGYQGLVSIPLHIQVIDEQLPTHLQGTLTVASCTTICVLTDYQVELDFTPLNLQVNDQVAFAYAKAMSQVPQHVPVAQLNELSAVDTLLASWQQQKQQVVVQIDKKQAWQNPDLFIDSDDSALLDVFFAKPTISISDNLLTASFDVTSWAGDVDLSNAAINLTVLDQDLSIELTTTLTEQAVPTTESSLISVFVLALLGGLILNVMPCVLPVLGMKLSSILGAKSQQRSTIRKQFIASSIGIVSSFWLIALFLLLLKLSGQALGWGIQFQSPLFIAFMVLVTALFTANMLGLFEIRLPSNMQTWLATRGGDAYLGHYLQGMFATLLATPCTAPFLGTAVAFALAASTWQLFMIFTALGLGMALPWIIIAIFPSTALLLPKPGRWMGSVKLVFGLMIFVTCLWLISLLTSFIGDTYSLLIALFFVSGLLVLTFYKHGKRSFMVVCICLLGLSGLGVGIYHLNNHSVTPVADNINWQALDTQLINNAVAEGKVVFVDVTADWCITCQANKVGVLLQEPIYSLLQQQDIVAVKGDWTVRAPDVTEYLQSFSRYGVPFNVVYGPAAPQGIELSTLLSTEAVQSAIQQAKGHSND